MRKYVVTMGNSNKGCFQAITILAKNKDQAIFMAGRKMHQYPQLKNATNPVHLLSCESKGLVQV